MPQTTETLDLNLKPNQRSLNLKNPDMLTARLKRADSGLRLVQANQMGIGSDRGEQKLERTVFLSLAVGLLALFPPAF